MIQDNREYEGHIKVLQSLLANQNELNHKKIDQEIDSIISIKKSFTNDLRLQSNRATRERYTVKLAEHDEVMRRLLAASPASVQSSSRAKVLSELIDRSDLYSHMEGRGNSELLSSAQGDLRINKDGTILA